MQILQIFLKLQAVKQSSPGFFWPNPVRYIYYEVDLRSSSCSTLSMYLVRKPEAYGVETRVHTFDRSKANANMLMCDEVAYWYQHR